MMAFLQDGNLFFERNKLFELFVIVNIQDKALDNNLLIFVI